jgi:hypothetical protein
MQGLPSHYHFAFEDIEDIFSNNAVSRCEAEEWPISSDQRLQLTSDGPTLCPLYVRGRTRIEASAAVKPPRVAVTRQSFPEQLASRRST